MGGNRRYKESWVVSHLSSANAQATASRAADSAGYHRAMSMSYTMCPASASMVATNAVAVKIRDGATGAGTVLWAEKIIGPGGETTRGSHRFINGLRGTKNTAMTVETSGSPGSDVILAVNLEGETYADPGAD